LKTRTSATRANAPAETTGANSAPPPDVHPVASHLLSLLLHHPEIAPHVQRTLHPEWLLPMDGGRLVQNLLESISTDEWEEPSPFIAALPEEERNFLTTLLMQPHPLPEDSSLEAYASELVNQIHKRGIHGKIQILEQEIKSNLLSPNDLIKKSKELIDLRNQRI
jgi:DNA primase DnaG DnaB-binding